jgi:predicted nucleic acid-binding protein
MRRVFVDTSAYSAFMRGHAGVTQVLQEADDICVSPIVLGELRAGFLRGGRPAKNEQELKTFLSSPRVRVVAIEEETAVRYAAILNTLWEEGTPVPTNDIWIAASAMQHGLVLLTADAHFQRIRHVLVEYLPTPSS